MCYVMPKYRTWQHDILNECTCYTACTNQSFCLVTWPRDKFHLVNYLSVTEISLSHTAEMQLARSTGVSSLVVCQGNDLS